MKLTKQTLKRIIKEELESILNEGSKDESIAVINPLLRQAFPSAEFRSGPHPKIPEITVIYSGDKPYAQISNDGTVAVHEIIYDNLAVAKKMRSALEANGIEYQTSIENI
jgi:hypothetical protein